MRTRGFEDDHGVIWRTQRNGPPSGDRTALVCFGSAADRVLWASGALPPRVRPAAVRGTHST